MSAEDELDLMRDEVALKELEVEYQAALEKVHGGGEADEAFKELRDRFAAQRTAFKLKREQAEAATEAGDAVVRPEAVSGTTGVREG
jgi:hypothetical protein